MPLIRGLDLGDASCLMTAPHQEKCAPTPSLLAFIVAGDARSFILPSTYRAYHQHVIRSFNAITSKQLLLYLKHDEPAAIEPMIAELQPARVRVVARNTHQQPLPNGTCKPPANGWLSPAYQARALRWWMTMNASWGLVRDVEMSLSIRFGAFFFSRPDLQFERDFGPSCLYDKQTWYTAGLGAPDWLWIIPGPLARKILTSVNELTSCHSATPCCEWQHRTHKQNTKLDIHHHDDWTFSYWIMTYWTAQENISVSTRLHGQAHLITKPPPNASTQYAHVGCGAPNCGRYARCPEEWSGFSSFHHPVLHET